MIYPSDGVLDTTAGAEEHHRNGTRRSLPDALVVSFRAHQQEVRGALAKIIDMPGPDGPVKAVDQTYDIVREDWNEYVLADGGRVRIKTVVQRIYRIVDAEGVPQSDENGDPKLIVRHGTLVTASD